MNSDEYCLFSLLKHDIINCYKERVHCNYDWILRIDGVFLKIYSTDFWLK